MGKNLSKDEAEQIIRRFYQVITDYFRDGEPFRLRVKVFEVAGKVEGALETLFGPEQKGK